MDITNPLNPANPFSPVWGPILYSQGAAAGDGSQATAIAYAVAALVVAGVVVIVFWRGRR